MVPSWGLTGRVYLGLEARPQPGISVHSMPIDGITPLLGASHEWVGRAEMSWRYWSGKGEGSHVNAIFTFPVLSNFIYVYSSLKNTDFPPARLFGSIFLFYLISVMYHFHVYHVSSPFPPTWLRVFWCPGVFRYRDTDFTGWCLRRFGLRVTGTNQSEGRRQWEARKPATESVSVKKDVEEMGGMLKWKWFWENVGI